MDKGKLDVVKQMARVNMDILGISELKWMGMGQFNSNDRYIHYCGQEFLRRNGVAIMVNERVQNAVFGSNSKTTERSLFVSLLLSRTQGYCYHLSKFHIHRLEHTEIQSWVE